jgi:hypothetical protein
MNFTSHFIQYNVVLCIDQVCLFLHLVSALFLLVVFVIVLQGSLGELFSLFSKLFWDLLVTTFCWTTQRADPSHLNLEFFVFVIFVRGVNNSCSCLDTFLQCQ